MLYSYDDSFVVDSIDPDVLEQEELKVVSEVEGLGVTDAVIKEKLVTSIVYMNLATTQMEAEGMKEKYDVYEKQYKRYYNISKTSTDTSISNIPIGRG